MVGKKGTLDTVLIEAFDKALIYGAEALNHILNHIGTNSTQAHLVRGCEMCVVDDRLKLHKPLRQWEDENPDTVNAFEVLKARTRSGDRRNVAIKAFATNGFTVMKDQDGS